MPEFETLTIRGIGNIHLRERGKSRPEQALIAACCPNIDPFSRFTLVKIEVDDIVPSQPTNLPGSPSVFLKFVKVHVVFSTQSKAGILGRSSTHL